MSNNKVIIFSIIFVLITTISFTYVVLKSHKYDYEKLRIREEKIKLLNNDSLSQEYIKEELNRLNAELEEINNNQKHDKDVNPIMLIIYTLAWISSVIIGIYLSINSLEGKGELKNV